MNAILSLADSKTCFNCYKTGTNVGGLSKQLSTVTPKFLLIPVFLGERAEAWGGQRALGGNATQMTASIVVFLRWAALRHACITIVGGELFERCGFDREPQAEQRDK